MSDDRTPAEIEREIEAERSALARSLEDLQATLSPERLLNQVTGYAKDNGGDIANGLVEQVKRNPLAAAVTGIGIAWLIAGARRPSYARHDAYSARHGYDPRDRSAQPEFATRRDLRPDEDEFRNHDSFGSDASPKVGYDDRSYPSAPGLSTSGRPMTGAYEGFDGRVASAEGSDTSKWDDAKDAAASKWDDATRSASDAWESTKDGVASAAAGAKDGASSAWDSAKGGSHAAWDGAKGSAHGAWAGTRDGAHDAASGARDGWNDATGYASDRYGAMRDSTSTAFRDWQASARGRYYAARARADGYRNRAYASSNELRARLAEGTESLSEQARARVMRARAAAMEAQGHLERKGRLYADKTGRAYDSQPLVFGGIALAVGALIGAGLPRTEQEDRAFGAYRDHLFDEAQHVFEEESRKAKAVAAAALDEAKDIADEAVSEVKGRAQGAVDEVKARAESALDTAKAKADGALGEAKAKADGAVSGAKASAEDAKASVPTGKAAVDAVEAKATSAAQRVADAAKSEAKKQDLGGSVRN